MSESQFHPDYLRPVDRVCDPDPRNENSVIIDELRYRPIEIQDYHARVARLALNKEVPEAIAIQFETAKNLYLYSWFVYRFFPIAEHHSLSCLELALRERYGREIPKRYFRKSTTPSLKPLLRFALDCGHIKNEGFSEWHREAEIRAKTRYPIDKIREMNEKGLSEIQLDYSEAQVTDADRDWDYINRLVEQLPSLRNRYAHGTQRLVNAVLETIQIVSEIINQIYPVRDKVSGE